MKIAGLFVSKKTEMYVRQLYPGSEADKRIRLLGCRKARMFFAVSAFSVLAFIPVFVREHAILSKPVTSLDRNPYGQGTRNVTLKVVSEDGYEDEVKVDVNERKYTDKELLKFSEKLDGHLWKYICGRNTVPENVTNDLELPERFDGYPFDITWKSDKPLILSGKGVINTGRLSGDDPEDKGITVQLRATLKYWDYTEDKYLCVVVHKRSISLQEGQSESINGSIKESDERSETESIQDLPETANGRRLIFYPSEINRGWIILFLGPATAFLLIRSKDEKIKTEAENRRNQIEADHPVILNQYMLYFTAGMNPRAIWNCMCKKYEESLKEDGAGRRYAYEEMLAARNRMDEGCSELAAYDEFAGRCDNIRFRSFIGFVKQAVVKGNEGLGELLSEEAGKALRERNNRVRTQASEAETKLLLPMFMMLIVVLAIVMIPAFMELN